MARVTAIIEDIPYRIEIQSPTGNTVIADEPIDKGGRDTGFSPKELLAASLSACSCATVRMFADRKNWKLQTVKLTVTLDHDEAMNETRIEREIEFVGDLTNDQRAILLKVANSCPIHKILTHPIHINTKMT